MVSKKTGFILLVVVVILMVVVGLWLKPIPQPQSYHHFADERSWLGVPNAWNVLSNAAFGLAGIWGLFLLFSHGKVQFIDKRERWLWVGVSVGLVLTAIGSSYYHLMPDNARLVWDRLPMVIIFMSYVAALIGERINMNLGLWLWPLLLGVGFYSVLLWQATELHGIGDLRFYLGVQIFAILATLVMLLTKSPYTRNWDLAIVVLFYGLAIAFDICDHQIFMLTDGIISGHTLKHLAAASAGAWLILMISKREINKNHI